MKQYIDRKLFESKIGLKDDRLNLFNKSYPNVMYNF